MKRNIAVVVLALVVTALSSALPAQDALSVGDQNMRLRLENDRVRVLERTLRPGEREKEHSHPSYLIVVVKGGKVRDHGADGKVAEVDIKAGDVLYRDPKTHWSENVGETDIDVIVVELKTAAP